MVRSRASCCFSKKKPPFWDTSRKTLLNIWETSGQTYVYLQLYKKISVIMDTPNNLLKLILS